MLLLLGVAAYLVACLASFSLDDPGWLYVGNRSHAENLGGPFGAWFADVTLSLFGYFAYLIPVMVAWSGVALLHGPNKEEAGRITALTLRWTGLLLVLFAGSTLAAMHIPVPQIPLPAGTASGGILGAMGQGLVVNLFNKTGSTLLMSAVLLSGFTLFSGVSLLVFLEMVGGGTLYLIERADRLLQAWWARRTAVPASPPNSPPKAGRAVPKEFDDEELGGTDSVDPPDVGYGRLSYEPLIGDLPFPEPLEVGTTKTTGSAPVRRRLKGERKDPTIGAAVAPDNSAAAKRIEPKVGIDQSVENGVKRKGGAVAVPEPPKPVTPSPTTTIAAPSMPLLAIDPDHPGLLPSLALLDEARAAGSGYSSEQLEEMSRQVELKLADFRIEAKVVGVIPGPVVTMFELQLAPGTKASKVTNLAKDLARALSTISVRVVEVIPGKSVIGLEIPNEQRETVYLGEVLSSEVYAETRSPLTLVLGKDISGIPTVADLAKMPHLLVAGTTGSGKSVAINAMILSLLFKATPEEVRLIMVDPKMLELSVYEGIPHLLTPVVTDMKEAANALRWCVAEMERRYKLMAAMGVRNIAGFNRKIKVARKQGKPLRDPLFQIDPLAPFEERQAPELDTLPYIVVIIDELADMMMVVGKKVEELIARLAQKARAAGIHLVLATQRPSVDVITGLIKANIPSRVAFQVSSRIDSRTILDQMGAESLLGNGDMLYLPPGSGIPHRLHGAFVDDDEVHRVVAFLKETGEPDYIDVALQEEFDEGGGFAPDGSDVEDSDPLFDEAVRFVTESRRASISAVQRRLKIGYNRAARMIEEMERIGLVSPAESNGNREVLAPPPVDL